MDYYENLDIFMDQNVAYKYDRNYLVPESICKVEKISANQLKITMPVIIDVEPIMPKRLEFKQT